MIFKIGVLENFAKFPEKNEFQICEGKWSFFLDLELEQALSLCLKVVSATFLLICF